MEKIFATLPDTEEYSDYDTAEEKLTAYFSPKNNSLYERYVFRQACQEQNERIDQFHTRLRHLSATCDFKDVDEEINNQLVEHCTSSRVRRKALREEVSLSDLLTYARSLEVGDRHTKEVTFLLHFYLTKTGNEKPSLLSCETSAELDLITLQLNAATQTYRSANSQHKMSPNDNKDKLGTEHMPDIETNKQTLEFLTDKHPAVFQGIGKLQGHAQKIHVDESVPPVAQTYRCVPFHLRKQLDSWLKDYVEKT